MPDREMQGLVREAERQGWSLGTSKGDRHIKLFAPDGKTIVTMPRTPGSRRSFKNALADLRRYGFRWQGR